jgi:catalase-peroxidase
MRLNLFLKYGFLTLCSFDFLSASVADKDNNITDVGCPYGIDEINNQSIEKPKLALDWWPNHLDLSPLTRNSSDPMGENFDYIEEFNKLDLKALKDDIANLLTSSQEFWPADYGNYGPFFIRMAWHSAGTYRVYDGRGGAGEGMQRFAPLNSWPDNINLDKARRLLWPIKQKYGSKISWADLMILTGNVAFESMGLKTVGFGGGRKDVFDLDFTNWGPETKWLTDERHDKNHNLEKPFAATEMGLIYVNPQGPNDEPDILGAVRDIRVTFSRMAMNDEETVALIAGGHTFGKAHGAADPKKYVGKEPEAAAVNQMGLGWISTFGKGNAEDTISSGLEGSWTSTPTIWDNSYFENLFNYEWTLTKSPAGAHQWIPKDTSNVILAPDAFDSSKKHLPIMFTTDLALRYDPIYEKISRRFHKDFSAFTDAFARAWFKLTHRDMGPISRYLGPDVPEESFIWQDPLPKATNEPVNASDIALLKQAIITSGLSYKDLLSVAWASASTYRNTDKRGGANGARIRLAPQIDWEFNKPKNIQNVISKFSEIQIQFNSGSRFISIADLIVLGGSVALEEAVKRAGFNFTVPFTPGRTDATQENTDINSFAYLEPLADGFTNFVKKGLNKPTPPLFVERAAMLDLSMPETVVLLGGMRALNLSWDNSSIGILTNKPGVLTNDFFINLLDQNTSWKKINEECDLYESFGSTKNHWYATSIDLLMGSNSQLRAISEVYASDDAKEKFVKDFIKVWVKVMMLDRFDVKN